MTDRAGEGGSFWTPFRRGFVAGVVLILLVVSIVWWVHRGVYACVAWGHGGETATCHVHSDKKDGLW